VLRLEDVHSTGTLGLTRVTAGVEEHVHEGIAKLPRTREVPAVIAFAPEAPSPRRQSVHEHRDTGGESLHAARQGDRVVGFDDEVKVVRLDREVKDAKPFRGCTLELDPKEARRPFGTKVGHSRSGAHADVHWDVLVEDRP